MAKLLLVLTLLLGALGALGVLTPPALTRKKQDTQEAPRFRSLQWYAQQARAEGKNEAVVDGDMIEYAGADSEPEEILAHATIVIARPVASVTKPYSDYSIGTKWKFKIVETLSEGMPCLRRCPERTPPDELLPLAEDEFILGRQVGSLFIDGVKLTIPHNPKIFPLFSEEKKYLLFLIHDSNRVMSLLVGPEAVFAVGDDEETLVPAGESQHRFKDFIKQRFDFSAGKLRQRLKDRKN